MAKKKVSFKIKDGFKPIKLLTAGKPFGIRAPFGFRIEPASTFTVDSGVSCDMPVIVVPTVVSAGAKQEAYVVPPNTGIRVNLTATSESVHIGEKEVVAKVYVVDNSDFEVEQ